VQLLKYYPNAPFFYTQIYCIDSNRYSYSIYLIIKKICLMKSKQSILFFSIKMLYLKIEFNSNPFVH